MIFHNSTPSPYRIWCDARTASDCIRYKDASDLETFIKETKKFVDFKSQHVCGPCTENYHQHPELHPRDPEMEALAKKYNPQCKKCAKYYSAGSRCSYCARQNGLKGGLALKNKVAGTTYFSDIAKQK